MMQEAVREEGAVRGSAGRTLAWTRWNVAWHQQAAYEDDSA